MRIAADFVQGVGSHFKGVGFAFKNPSYLPLILIPFCLTIAVYAAAIYFFASYDQALLDWIWKPDQAQADGLMAVLYWIYKYVVKYLLYLILMFLMYFLFMVLANIIASPIYDMIAGRIGKFHGAGGGESIGVLRTVVEEVKKAVFVLIPSLLFLFIPVLGGFLSVIYAMIMLGWDFHDFSLSRDKPKFSDRLAYVRKNLFLLLGFGSLLLVPILGFFIYPFAILGSSLCYQQRKGGK